MREPVSGHEVVKKKKDCNNLEKETVGLEKVKVIARIHTDFPTKFEFQAKWAFRCGCACCI